MTIRKLEFKGVRKQCERCEDLWPHMDIAENGQCPKCLQETQTITFVCLTEYKGCDIINIEVRDDRQKV